MGCEWCKARACEQSHDAGEAVQERVLIHAYICDHELKLLIICVAPFSLLFLYFLPVCHVYRMRLVLSGT